MAGGRIFILILCIAFAQAKEHVNHSTVSPPSEAEDVKLHVYTICPGNFSACMRPCAASLSKRGRCIACKCERAHQDIAEPGSPKPMGMVQLGPISLSIGSMEQPFWQYDRFGREVAALPGRKLPYVIYDVVRNRGDDDAVLPELTEHLERTNFSDHPIAIPVISRYSSSFPMRNLQMQYPGVLHLPFRLGNLAKRQIPGMMFPNCMLPQSNGARNDLLVSIRTLVNSTEVAMEIPRVLKSLLPGINLQFGENCNEYGYMQYDYSENTGLGGTQYDYSEKPEPSETQYGYWQYYYGDIPALSQYQYYSGEYWSNAFITHLADIAQKYAKGEKGTTKFDKIISYLSSALDDVSDGVSVIVKSFKSFVEKLKTAATGEDIRARLSDTNFFDKLEFDKAMTDFQSVASSLPKKGNNDTMKLLAELSEKTTSGFEDKDSFEPQNYTYSVHALKTALEKFLQSNQSKSFEIILESLTNSIKNDSSAEHGKVFKKIRHFVEEFRNASLVDKGSMRKLLARINITDLSNVLSNYNRISHLIYKDRNFRVLEYLFSLLERSMISHVRDIAKCMTNQLLRHAHRIKLKRFIPEVIQHVCKGDKINATKEDTKNKTMTQDERINATVHLAKEFNRNSSMEKMLEMWLKMHKNDTPWADVRIWTGIMKNLTKLSNITTMEETRREAEKFWKWVPMLKETFAMAFMNQSNFAKIRYLRRRLLSLMPKFPYQKIPLHALCRMAKDIAVTIGDSNATLADALGELSITDERQSDIGTANISAFMNLNNMTIPSNMSISEFKDLIISTMRSFMEGEVSRPYSEYVSNITKITQFYPKYDRATVQNCLQELNIASDYPKISTKPSPSRIPGYDTPDKSCLFHIFQPYLQDDHPFNKTYAKEFSNSTYEGSITNRHPSKGKEIGQQNKSLGDVFHSDGKQHFPSVAVHAFNRIESHQNVYMKKCKHHAVPGVIVPRQCVHCVNDSRREEVYFKAPARWLLTHQGIKMMPQSGFFSWGLLWINAGPQFNASKFLRDFSDSSDSSGNTTDPTGEGEIQVSSRPKSIPFEPSDDIEEIFVLLKETEIVDMKTMLMKYPSVARWAVQRSSGMWIVKDLNTTMNSTTEREPDTSVLISEQPGLQSPERNEARKSDNDAEEELDKFQDVGVHLGPAVQFLESNIDGDCPRNIPNGWRCLLPQDSVSANATLRLVYPRKAIALGILALSPLDSTSTSIQDAFGKLSRVKNLVALTPPSKIMNQTEIKFGFAEPTYEMKLYEGEQKIVNISDQLRITSVGPFVDMEKIKSFLSPGSYLVNYFSKVGDFVKWPDVEIQANSPLVITDLLVKYRSDRSSTWTLLRPDGKGKLERTIAPTGQISLQTRRGFSRGVKHFVFKMNGLKARVKITILRKLSLTVPKSFRIPAVPYDLRSNNGFNFVTVASELQSSVDFEDSSVITGLAVVTAPTSDVGKWQMKYSERDEWMDMDLFFHTSTRIRRDTYRSAEKLRTVRQVISCDMVPQVVALLHPETRIRFEPKSAELFWKAKEARTSTTITLSLYRIDKDGQKEVDVASDLYVKGYALVNGVYEVDPICSHEIALSSFWDFLTLLSPEKVIFPIEREGCDGTRSSMKITVDICGECGGHNQSCVDCNGEVQGGAYLDKCRKCVGGKTKILPTVLDCANSCDNTSYLDECSFCQRRGKWDSRVKDCEGNCYGTSRLDKCGACRRNDGTIANLPEGATVMDLCGVCGGTNSSCADCDGVPKGGKVVDACGNCALPDSDGFNKGCDAYTIYRVYPSMVVVNDKSKEMTLHIAGYFHNKNKANCSLRTATDQAHIIDLGELSIFTLKSPRMKMNTVGHMMKTKIKASDLLPQNIDFAMWNLACTSQQNRAELATPLLARTLDPWKLASITPEYFAVGNGGGNVTITGTNFTSEVELVCTASHYAFATPARYNPSEFEANMILKVPKLLSVHASFVDDKHVRCSFPNFNKPAKITVYVLPKNEVKTTSPTMIARNVRGGVKFEYREKAPAVLKALLSPDLEFIIISFDVDIIFPAWKASKNSREFCNNLLEVSSGILGDNPRCYARGSKILMIKPGRGASLDDPLAQILGTITLKEGAVVGRSGGGATEPFPETEVSISPPEEKTPPKVRIRSAGEFGPCEIAKIVVSAVRGVGTMPFNYIWTVAVEETPITNTGQSITDFLRKTAEGQSFKTISFSDFQGTLQAGGNYTIGVKVQNIFGNMSDEVTTRIHIKTQTSPLRVAIRGPLERTVRASSKITLKAVANFLKPKCGNGTENDENLGASSLKNLKIAYIWSVSEQATGYFVNLESNTERVLKIAKQTIKPGNYRFTVTAFYYKYDVIASEASASVLVNVEGGPIQAVIRGPRSRVVMSDKTMSLDGSLSYDPKDGNLSYSWTCEDMLTGVPCTVVKSADGSSPHEVERADVAFLNFQAGSNLDFPASRFPSGLLANMTLTVRSGEREATDFVRVLIQDASDHLPSIIVKQVRETADETFSVHKTLRVKAAVIGNINKNWTMIMRWNCVEEDGFVCVELEAVSKTAIEKIGDVTSLKSTQFSLVLKKNVLQPGSRYKFLLEARPDPTVHQTAEGDDETANALFATVEIRTTPIPSGGTFAITPTNGTALETEFVLKATDWVSGDDQDVALEYKFGYMDTTGVKENNRKITFLGSFARDQPEMTAYLPPGNPKLNYKVRLVALIRIEGSEDATRIVTAEVVVKPPITKGTGEQAVDDNVLRNMINHAAEAMVSGDRATVISTIVLVGKTIQSNKTKQEVRNLAEAAMKDFESFKPTSESDAEDALESVNNLLGTFNDDVGTSVETKQIALDIMDATMKELYNKKDAGSSSRRRRAVETTTALSVEMAERMLDLYETIFDSSGNDESFLQDARSSFKEDTEFIMQSFCTSVEYGEPAQTARTGSMVVGARKVEMPYGESFSYEAFTFIFNETVESDYSDWQCDPSDSAPCPGACISFGNYKDEVLHSYQDSSIASATRMSPIIGIFIRNPADGSQVSPDIDRSSQSALLTMSFSNLTLPVGGDYQIECRHLDFTSVWTNESCVLSSFTSSQVICQCGETSGYFAVYAHETASTYAQSSIPETTIRSEQETSTVSDSASTTPKCSPPLIEATTCPERCLDMCHKEGDSYCEEICYVGACICPHGQYKTKEGLCHEKECPEKDPPPQPTGMGAAAIAGLSIAIVVVTATLAFVVYLYYKKSKERQVTPIGSLAMLEAPPKYREEMRIDDKNTLVAEEKVANEYSTEPTLPNVADEQPPQYSAEPGAATPDPITGPSEEKM